MAIRHHHRTLGRRGHHVGVLISQLRQLPAGLILVGRPNGRTLPIRQTKGIPYGVGDLHGIFHREPHVLVASHKSTSVSLVVVMIVIMLSGYVADLHHGDHTGDRVSRGLQGGFQPSLRARGDHHVGVCQGNNVLGGGLKAVDILSELVQGDDGHHLCSPVLRVVLNQGSYQRMGGGACDHDGDTVIVGGRMPPLGAPRKQGGHAQKQGHAKQNGYDLLHLFLSFYS